MQIRRSILLTATAAVVALSLAGAGALAYASGDDPETENVADDKASASPSESETEEFKPEKVPAAAPAPEHDCGETGEYQEDVEQLLADLGGYGDVTVDGVQTQEDCDAITAFQQRMGIEPAAGYAGEVTLGIAERINESDLDKCDAEDGLVVCIDLTHQTLWVTDDGEMVYEPTVVRTGMAGGYQTATGKHTITNKAEREWSKPYKVWLPSWQHFYNGQGLHETTTYLHDSFGSHGCVNLLHEDAVALYELVGVGDTIHVFGNRPGT